MRDKRLKELFYKEIHIHPLCNFYFRCERYNGKTYWYQIFKFPDSITLGKAIITRKEVGKRLKDELDYWYN